MILIFGDGAERREFTELPPVISATLPACLVVRTLVYSVGFIDFGSGWRRSAAVGGASVLIPSRR